MTKIVTKAKEEQETKGKGLHKDLMILINSKANIE
jgi:hypothetical protein